MNDCGELFFSNPCRTVGIDVAHKAGSFDGPIVAEALDASLKTDEHDRSIPKRKSDDVLDEILEMTRITAHQLTRLGLEVDLATQPPQRIYPRGSVGEFSQELNKNVDVLLEQLASAGVKKVGPGAPLSETDKQKLLGYLQASHGTVSSERKKSHLSVDHGCQRTPVDWLACYASAERFYTSSHPRFNVVLSHFPVFVPQQGL